MSVRIGAPGSVARHVQETLERNPCHYGENRFVVFEYGPRGTIIMRAGSRTRSTAERYMADNRVLVDVDSYRPNLSGRCSRR